MSDRLREAGIIVGHLSRALLDGSRDLSTIPALIKRVIREDMWPQRVDPASGKKIPDRRFRSFHEFVGTPADEGGLGSSVRQLEALCKDDKEALSAIEAVTNQGHGGDRRSSTFKLNNVQVEKAPVGNKETAALRTLRKRRPDLHAEVLAGHLKAAAAMIEAGFRPKTITVPVTRPESIARSLRKYMKPDDIAKLVALLVGDISAYQGRDLVNAVVPCRRRVPLPPESTSNLAISKGSMGDRWLLVERPSHRWCRASPGSRVTRRHPRDSGRASRGRAVAAETWRLRVPRVSLTKPFQRSCGKRTKGSSRTTKTQAAGHEVTP